LTYTLSKSENYFPQLFKGQYFPAPDDSRNQLKWLYHYHTKKYDFSFTYSGATGRPYLDLSELKNNVNRENLELTKFIKNLKDYHRVDLGVGYTLYPLGVKTRIGLSVFNVLNRVNASYQQFLFQLPGNPLPTGNPVNTILGSEVSQLERTWNLSVQFSFQDL
jgi:hypothetical protein